MAWIVPLSIYLLRISSREIFMKKYWKKLETARIEIAKINCIEFATKCIYFLQIILSVVLIMQLIEKLSALATAITFRDSLTSFSINNIRAELI